MPVSLPSLLWLRADEDEDLGGVGRVGRGRKGGKVGRCRIPPALASTSGEFGAVGRLERWWWSGWDS